MFRPTALRAVAGSTRSLAARQPARIALRPQPVRQQALRKYATTTTTPPPPPPPPSQNASSGGGGGGNGPMLIVLAAIVAVGAGGYYYMKPVRDVAATTHQAIESVKGGAGNLGDLTQPLASVAKAMLPPGAFALYSKLADQPGGLNGFLSSLKDKDLQGVIDEAKKHGGDDVKRVIEKVEKRVKDAKGKVEDVDWRAVAEDLKAELPEGSQHAIEMFIGKIPDKADFDAYIKKVKDMGEEKRKELESAASKVLERVKKAQKDGKGQADALLKGLKDAAPADVDALLKQLKDTAKSAGLPADTIEAWLKSKAEDGKVNAEETAAQLKSKLKTGAKYIPGEPKELVEQVKQFSPSIAELLAQALKEAGVVDDKLNRKV